MPPTEFIIFTAEPGLVPFRRRSDHFRTNHEYRPWDVISVLVDLYGSYLALSVIFLEDYDMH